MNGVIYARYSDHTQREESIEGQIRICKQYAEEIGVTIIHCYIDRAQTAKTDDRIEFQKMIRDSRTHAFEVVIVYQLDRFARSRYDSAIYKYQLKKNGVKVLSAKEKISDDASGILVEGVLESMAEYYSEELSQKIRRGQTENALKGKNNGGGIPLGYQLNPATQKLEIDPMTAPLVLEIFQRYADGETKKAIVDSLNERGILTRKGKPFTLGSFNTIFSNRKYIGEYRYRDTIIPDGVPPIVPLELFEAVQVRVGSNKRAPGRMKADVDYLLSCKLFCGSCGTMMVGESGTSKTGVIHYYYKCGQAKRTHVCKKRAVQKEPIEKLVVQTVAQYILRDDVIRSIAKLVVEYQEQEDPTPRLLEKQKKEVHKKIQNILTAIENGAYSEALQKRLAELEAQQEELEIQYAQVSIHRLRFMGEDIIRWLEHFRDMDLEDTECQKQMIDCFVQKVYVYDDRLVLIFNVSSTEEEVPFDLVQSSDFATCVPP